MPAKLTTQQFIDRANVAHNSKYGYDNVRLVRGVHTKVQIECPVHGLFLQKANDHLRCRGCFKCKEHVPKLSTKYFVDFWGTRIPPEPG